MHRVGSCDPRAITFTGTPTAPNPPPGDSSTRIATTAYVQSLAGFAPLASPAFTGVPTAPTPTPGTNTTQLATTAFVEAAVANSTAGVASFNGRTGAVTLQANDISAAGGALLASPALTGTPTAPTAALGVSTTQLATCAYVMNAASTTTPLMDGTAAVGTGTTWARSNHVHPTDTSRAAQASLANYLPLAGGTLTGPLTGTTATFTSVAAAPFADMTLGNAGGENRLTWSASAGYFFAWATAGGQWRYVTQNGSLQAVIIDAFGNLTIAGAGSQPGGGPWASASDARIKTVAGPYDLGLDEVLALRPVVYTFKGNDTTSASRSLDGATGNDAPYPASPHFAVAKAKRQFVGMVAQEVEPVFPGMVIMREGYIDGEKVDDFRDLDTGPLIFALVNAVKTLAARVAALEAA